MKYVPDVVQVVRCEDCEHCYRTPRSLCLSEKYQCEKMLERLSSGRVRTEQTSRTRHFGVVTMIYPFKRSDYSHAFTAWHLKMLPILNDETLNILNSEVQFILLWSACGSEEKYTHVGVSEFCVEDYPMDNYIS